MTQCKAMTKLYEQQCGNISIKGSKFCWMHTPGYQQPMMKLKAENAKLKEACRNALNELGVPRPGYPQPVANAVEILHGVLKEKP